MTRLYALLAQGFDASKEYEDDGVYASECLSVDDETGERSWGDDGEYEPAIEATAHGARESDTGVDGGMDAQVTVTIGDTMYHGEVTLVRSEYDGSWGAWGQPANWISGDLLAKLVSLPAAQFRAAREAIEAAAAKAIEAAS